MNHLLDTNVISEPMRKRPDPRVMAWLRNVNPASVHVSVLTFGEIMKGIAQQERRHAVQARALRRWLDATRREYSERTVAVDTEIADVWGRLTAKRPLPVVDGLLAATALVRHLTFVTRDTRDIAGTGVTVFNPWEG